MLSNALIAPFCWGNLPNWPELVVNADPDIISICTSLTPEESFNLLHQPNSWHTNIQKFSSESFKCKLKSNPGFFLIRCNNTFSDKVLREIYAIYSILLGNLNNRYEYFFDVVDQGLDYKKAAIPVSKTRETTGYHTDSTAKEYLPDVVGLLCLHPAVHGGDTLLANSADLYNHLQKNFSSSLKEMEYPIMRDIITPGSANDVKAIFNNSFPIFSFPKEGFTFRYMRYWIEIAFSKTGQKPNSDLIKGLDATDAFFSEKKNNVQFRMERGDILFINNRFLCHNRTSFLDDECRKEKRTLVRTWINFKVL
jgi:hypothetical protein